MLRVVENNSIGCQLERTRWGQSLQIGTPFALVERFASYGDSIAVNDGDVVNVDVPSVDVDRHTYVTCQHVSVLHTSHFVVCIGASAVVST